MKSLSWKLAKAARASASNRLALTRHPRRWSSQALGSLYSSSSPFHSQISSRMTQVESILRSESHKEMFAGYQPQPKSMELLSSIQIPSLEAVDSVSKIRNLLMLPDENSREIFDFAVAICDLEKHLKAVAIKRAEVSLDLINVLAGVFSCKFVLEQDLQKRKPVICVMGHVDHGKTTLLDYYRNTRKAAMEVGGITQKIGGFTMATKFGEVSFIDTPGHALFSNMRQTGAFLADMAILIVSAVEGVQPQTVEVLQLIKEFGLPFVVAINKIDANGADPELVEEQLTDLGVELVEYGGNIESLHISAKTGHNVDMLLELLVEETNKLQLRGDFGAKAECLVLETALSTIDMKKTSVLVKNGQLVPGSFLHYSNSYFKVAKILDDLGRPMEAGQPGDICEVYGVQTLPTTVERVFGTSTEALARLATQLNKSVKDKFFPDEVDMSFTSFKVQLNSRRERNKFRGSEQFRKTKILESKAEIERQIAELAMKEANRTEELSAKEALDAKLGLKKMPTLEELNNQNRSLTLILSDMEDVPPENPILIKVSNMGTRDTIMGYLDKLEKKNFTVVDITCGQITEHDVTTARQLKAKIVVFDLPTPSEIEKLVRDAGIGLVSHNIIYKLFEDMESWKTREEAQADAQPHSKNKLVIKRVFSGRDSRTKDQQIAGVKVEEGTVKKAHTFRLVRKGIVVANNLKVSSMKHFKDEVDTLEPRMEGGMTFQNTVQFLEGDVLEAY